MAARRRWLAVGVRINADHTLAQLELLKSANNRSHTKHFSVATLYCMRVTRSAFMFSSRKFLHLNYQLSSSFCFRDDYRWPLTRLACLPFICRSDMWQHTSVLTRDFVHSVIKRGLLITLCVSCRQKAHIIIITARNNYNTFEYTVKLLKNRFFLFSIFWLRNFQFFKHIHKCININK